jgi:hypothetical protein
MAENNTSGVNSGQPLVKESRLDHVLSFGEGDLHHKRMELLSAIILSLATILTAWCGYQATRWSGEQALYYSEASALRIKSAQKDNEATQLSAIHVGLFVQYSAAISQDNRALADFLYQRFPPPLKAATDAWLATQPLKNPDAPAGPFQMPEYVLPQTQEAKELDVLADQKFQQANEANERSDKYVLLTVIFASVLFFGGISTQFESRAIETGMLVVALIVLLATAAVMLTFPLK